MLRKLVTFFGVRPGKILHTDSIVQVASVTRAAVSSMTGRVGKREVRVETFEEAVERLGLTAAKLERRRFELMVESRIAYGMMFLAIALSFYFIAAERLLGVVAGLCAILMFGVIGLTRAFRVHQIDRRELMSFSAFLRSLEGIVK